MGGVIGGCHRPLRSMLNEPDKYGVYGKSTEERCECEADADVNGSAYGLNETADDGSSDTESSLIRQRLLKCASNTAHVRCVARRERQRVTWDTVRVRPGERVYTTRAKRNQQRP